MLKKSCKRKKRTKMVKTSNEKKQFNYSVVNAEVWNVK